MGEMMMLDKEMFKEWFMDAFEPFATSIQQEFIRLGDMILENRTAIQENRTAIQENRAALEKNAVAIAENRRAIEKNAVAINDLRTEIAEMRLELGVIKGILREILQRLERLETQSAAQQREITDLRRRVTRLEEAVFASC